MPFGVTLKTANLKLMRKKDCYANWHHAKWSRICFCLQFSSNSQRIFYSATLLQNNASNENKQKSIVFHRRFFFLHLFTFLVKQLLPPFLPHLDVFLTTPFSPTFLYNGNFSRFIGSKISNR